MKPRPTPPPPPSSPSCVPAPIELAGSRRLGLAWSGWCLLLAWELGLRTGLPPWGRAAAAAVALAALRPGWRRLSGPPAWAALRPLADGRWQGRDRAGRWHYVALGPPRRLGPLVWWPGAGPAGSFRLLLDAGAMEPIAARRLQSRVRVPGPHPRRRQGDRPSDERDVDPRC